MTETRYDDETLMAFTDGELDPATVAEVARAAAADPAVASRIAVFARSRAALAAEAVHPEPVPADLEARVRAMAVGAGARPAAARGAPLWQPALAAGLALAVGLGAGLILGSGRQAGAPAGLEIALGSALPAPLAEALGRVPSGMATRLPEGGQFAPVASFMGGDGALCREFSLEAAAKTVVAVACRDGNGDGGVWRARIAVAAAPAGASFQPAGGLEALDAYLATEGAGPPLSPEAEAAALASR